MGLAGPPAKMELAKREAVSQLAPAAKPFAPASVSNYKTIRRTAALVAKLATRVKSVQPEYAEVPVQQDKPNALESAST